MEDDQIDETNTYDDKSIHLNNSNKRKVDYNDNSGGESDEEPSGNILDGEDVFAIIIKYLCINISISTGRALPVIPIIFSDDVIIVFFIQVYKYQLCLLRRS